MAQIGSIKVETSSEGTVEIPIFEIGDVDLSAWRVQTESGTGAINLVDPENAELDQVKVQTSQGVKAVSTKITGQLSVTADFTLNNQNAKLTVFEDVDGDGIAEYTETIQLQDGTQTYDLTEIQGYEFSTYWVQTNLENPDIDKTVQISQITLEVGINPLIDNFEEALYEDKGYSLTDYYSIEDGGFERTTDKVYKGNYSLRPTATGQQCVLISLDDETENELLDRYPKAGDTIEWRHRAETTGPWSALNSLMIAVQSINSSDPRASDGYQLVADYANDKHRIRKDGENLVYENVNFSNYTGEWLRSVLKWGKDGELVYTVYDSDDNEINQISHNDTTYTSGGVGYHTSVDSKGDFHADNIRLI